MRRVKNYSIDTVKCFAAFAVIVIHTQPFKCYEDLYFIIRTMCSFAVPFFFVSTGYLLANGLIKSNDEALNTAVKASGIPKEMFIQIINNQIASNNLVADEGIDFHVKDYLIINLGGQVRPI